MQSGRQLRRKLRSYGAKGHTNVSIDYTAKLPLTIRSAFLGVFSWDGCPIPNVDPHTDLEETSLQAFRTEWEPSQIQIVYLIDSSRDDSHVTGRHQSWQRRVAERLQSAYGDVPSRTERITLYRRAALYCVTDQCAPSCAHKNAATQRACAVEGL
ncbi:hypothetical protein LSTR_LSTR005039 [Laodelphax striatellus]|uniref:Uncharacterized protein n=1 Tax=Laodelphax striatellus TaxID=195883 RepID=A0A482WTV2_LAOST|nr:hypothetical protein LSTR_LSTR005039 [Laodelphax striatellus]